MSSVLSEIHTQSNTIEIAQAVLPECSQNGQLLDNKQMYLFVKRFWDVVISAGAIVILAVPMLFIACTIRLDSPGNAIFTQKRIGKDGKSFSIYKFRTMRTDAPEAMPAPEFADADKYITKVGAVLRRTSLDELPQLLNVLHGSMSLVGYRPICVTETDLNECRMRCGVFAMKPGITGLAQVSGRDNLSMEEKVRLDTQYVCECSAKMDLWCLLKTIAVVISGEGVQ